MKWNASAFAALFLLAGCGGGGGYGDYGPETSGPPPGSPAAQAWTPNARPAASETWRNASGEVRSRDPEPQPPQPAYGTGAAYPAPGSSYPPPAQAYAPPPAPAQPESYAPPPSYPSRPVASIPQDGYPDPTAGATGPRGTSGQGPERYDEVGYAGVRPVAGGGAGDGAVVAVARSLPADSFAEVTALDSGRTILVLVTGGMGPGADHAIDLSAGAARQLGFAGTGVMPVRIRKVTATPGDIAALRAGQPATQRADTPPVLLNALRKQLPAARAAVAPSASGTAYSRPSATVRAARPASGAGYYVQVAALSHASNAQSLAQSMGGFVKQGGGLYRVQLGPFASQREAEQARAGAARAGFGDARVFAVN